MCFEQEEEGDDVVSDSEEVDYDLLQQQTDQQDDETCDLHCEKEGLEDQLDEQKEVVGTHQQTSGETTSEVQRAKSKNTKLNSLIGRACIAVP